MKGRHIPYSADELAWIEARATEPRRATHAQFVEVFGRNDVTFDALKQLCQRKGWKTGRTGRFDKGSVPVNKGVPCPPGQGGRHPNARKTQFKSGSRSGRAAERYKPIGTERVSKDGYRERKIHDGLPMQSRWRLVHVVRWEETTGPLPEGMCLKCLDGDRLNTEPSNWELISRAALPYVSGRYGFDYDGAPAELKPALLATAKLKHSIKSKKKARAQ